MRAPRFSLLTGVLAGLISASTACQTAMQPEESATPASMPAVELKVGDTAPDFTLPDHQGNPIKLSDFRGKKNVVLAFYVLAFTGG